MKLKKLCKIDGANDQDVVAWVQVSVTSAGDLIVDYSYHTLLTRPEYLLKESLKESVNRIPDEGSATVLAPHKTMQ